MVIPIRWFLPCYTSNVGPKGSNLQRLWVIGFLEVHLCVDWSMQLLKVSDEDVSTM